MRNIFVFFFQAEDGIRDTSVTGVQTCALPIYRRLRVQVLQNGAFFERLLDDIARAESTIHIESYIWWTGEICVRMAEALAARSEERRVGKECRCGWGRGRRRRAEQRGGDGSPR